MTRVDKSLEQARIENQAQALKVIIIQAIPANSDYAAILLALAELTKEIVRFWVKAEQP